MLFLQNFKTTLGGVASVFVGLFQMYSGDVVGGSAAAVSGLGLIFASDAS